jgi:G6PDH family F420-dependent oxidoreductase
MARFGYTLMCEQSAPEQLVRDARAAERAGFEFATISDHFQPWVEAQGHSPYAWSVLGAVAVATERIELMTAVTCPTLRYHPAIVAQKSATVALLAGGRFRLGLGSGERLNEHVIGGGWPSVGIRHELLVEAVQIIRALLDGERVSLRGRHFEVAGARLWDAPRTRVPIGIAASGPVACRLAARHADLLIADEPRRELCESFAAAGGAGKPRVGLVTLAYDSDRERALRRAHEQLGWSALGWKAIADLPNQDAFEAARALVTPEQVAAQIACGPDLAEHVQKIRAYLDAGFEELALLQIGAEEQEPFLAWAEAELLPALRAL